MQRVLIAILILAVDTLALRSNCECVGQSDLGGAGAVAGACEAEAANSTRRLDACAPPAPEPGPYLVGVRCGCRTNCTDISYACAPQHGGGRCTRTSVCHQDGGEEDSQSKASDQEADEYEGNSDKIHSGIFSLVVPIFTVIILK